MRPAGTTSPFRTPSAAQQLLQAAPRRGHGCPCRRPSLAVRWEGRRQARTAVVLRAPLIFRARTAESGGAPTPPPPRVRRHRPPLFRGGTAGGLRRLAGGGRLRGGAPRAVSDSGARAGGGDGGGGARAGPPHPTALRAAPAPASFTQYYGRARGEERDSRDVVRARGSERGRVLFHVSDRAVKRWFSTFCLDCFLIPTTPLFVGGSSPKRRRPSAGAHHALAVDERVHPRRLLRVREEGSGHGGAGEPGGSRTAGPDACRPGPQSLP